MSLVTWDEHPRYETLTFPKIIFGHFLKTKALILETVYVQVSLLQVNIWDGTSGFRLFENANIESLKREVEDSLSNSTQSQIPKSLHSPIRYATKIYYICASAASSPTSKQSNKTAKILDTVFSLLPPYVNTYSTTNCSRNGLAEDV
jgi:hypothetical protein